METAPPSFGDSGVPTPPPGPRRRTPVVTAAGGMLITAGALTLLAGLIVVLAGSDVLVNGEEVGGGTRTLATLVVVLGAVDVVAGILVLRLVAIGRSLGMGLAGITALVGLVSLIQGNPRAVLQVLLGGLTIWALVVAEPAFRRDARG
jgi:low temperature requirement protein LtrA